MQTPWIFSSTFLPYTGEPIDFMLEDRSQPIHGTFVNGVFHSRWADYGADRVQSWRGSHADRVAAPMEMPKAATPSVFITMLKRLSNGLSRGRNAQPVAQRRSHARIAVAPPTAVKYPSAVALRRVDSNQISS